MNPRDNLMMASCIDLAIILLPLIGHVEAERMMVRASVPQAIIERTLMRPGMRRTVTEPIRLGQAPIEPNRIRYRDTL